LARICIGECSIAVYSRADGIVGGELCSGAWALECLATVPGVTLGDFTAITASLLGAGALLQASAAIYRPGASAPDASRYPGGDLPLPRNAQHYSLGFDGE